MQVENQECSPSSNAVHGGPRARGWGNQERHQPHLHNMIFEKKPISPILEASSPFPLESNCFRNHPTHMVKKKKFARFLIGEYYYSFTESKLFVCFKKIFFYGVQLCRHSSALALSRLDPYLFCLLCLVVLALFKYSS